MNLAGLGRGTEWGRGGGGRGEGLGWTEHHYTTLTFDCLGTAHCNMRLIFDQRQLSIVRQPPYWFFINFLYSVCSYPIHILVKHKIIFLTLLLLQCVHFMVPYFPLAYVQIIMRLWDEVEWHLASIPHMWYPFIRNHFVLKRVLRWYLSHLQSIAIYRQTGKL